MHRLITKFKDHLSLNGLTHSEIEDADIDICYNKKQENDTIQLTIANKSFPKIKVILDCWAAFKKDLDLENPDLRFHRLNPCKGT